MKKILLGMVALTFIFGLVAMSGRKAVGEPLAEINGQVITAAEIEKAIGDPFRKLQEQIYNLKRQKLEEMINARLLMDEAEKRGISVAALLDAEVTSKVALVTEEEVEQFYESNKTRIPGDPIAARQQIRVHLQNERIAAQKRQFFELLRAKARISVHLQPPPIHRAEISTDGAPSKGSARAPVTIVKFEDFHCPFCKKAQPTLAQVLSKYGKKVRLVHRDFPIDSIHPLARQAHEAARCADEQGKFWEYHDLLYANAPKAELTDLKSYAKELGLNLPGYEKCLASGKYREIVQKDVDEGARLGVNGTPTFFINGRLLAGAQPLGTFTAMIDEELSQRR